MDFFAPSINLVIEVDGDYHNVLEQHYQDRDVYLNVLGILVLRFSNHQIESDIQNAIQIIKTNILK